MLVFSLTEVLRTFWCHHHLIPNIILILIIIIIVIFFQFDGSLADLLKSGSKEEPRLYFRSYEEMKRLHKEEELER